MRNRRRDPFGDALLHVSIFLTVYAAVMVGVTIVELIGRL